MPSNDEAINETIATDDLTIVVTLALVRLREQVDLESVKLLISRLPLTRSKLDTQLRRWWQTIEPYQATAAERPGIPISDEDLATTMACDREFHDHLWKMLGGDHYSHLASRIAALNVLPIKRAMVFDFSERWDSLQLHESVRDALILGDEDAATVAIRRHYRRTMDDVLLSAGPRIDDPTDERLRILETLPSIFLNLSEDRLLDVAEIILTESRLRQQEPQAGKEVEGIAEREREHRKRTRKLESTDIWGQPEIRKMVGQPLGSPVSLTREQAVAILKAGLPKDPNLPSGEAFTQQARRKMGRSIARRRGLGTSAN